MDLRQFFEYLPTAQRVYGEPYEKDGVTVIPAVAMRIAGGFGHNDSKGQGPIHGGGGGGLAFVRPVGSYVIGKDGVSWEPVVDVNRIVFGGQILAGLALMVYALRTGERKRRR
ncbi:sporulation protein [Sphaerisporangium sp. TRM90804]|uniref:sporulation protein n=1 Tax=Sphaerisporangium sp. TRM90804 TaxID=3031113 RepID=UPI00244D71D5|nr:sporulation protein [Sphaerisporangium sp. TRM90804]MDH2424035.1 sporulation protein [Sphaerisporangium sp. TRM90804]